MYLQCEALTRVCFFFFGFKSELGFCFPEKEPQEGLVVWGILSTWLVKSHGKVCGLPRAPGSSTISLHRVGLWLALLGGWWGLELQFMATGRSRAEWPGEEDICRDRAAQRTWGSLVQAASLTPTEQLTPVLSSRVAGSLEGNLMVRQRGWEICALFDIGAKPDLSAIWEQNDLNGKIPSKQT